MILTRRHALGLGGALIAALFLRTALARSSDATEIVMGGRSDGSRVWFNPAGVLIKPGQTVRWINRDAGNAHTATAYHPANFDKPRRIPQSARPWDTDYLLPGGDFSVTFTVPGVYDYFCVPHEHAGMVGRIIVGAPQPEQHGGNTADEGIPVAALQAFPSVEDIMKKGAVWRD